MASGPIRHHITGIQEVFNELNNAKIDAELAMLRALNTAVQDIAGHADEMVPVDEGALRGSQNIDNPSRRGDTIEASISYGGPSAPYALVQHENKDLWHPPKPPGKRKVGGRQGTGPTAPGDTTFGGPKYLEYPFDQETQNWPEGFVSRLVAAGMDLLRK